MFDRRQFLASLSAFLVPAPMVVNAAPVAPVAFGCVAKSCDVLFTLGDLETIAGRVLFEDNTDRQQVLNDFNFILALKKLETDGVIWRMVTEPPDGFGIRAFGARRRNPATLSNEEQAAAYKVATDYIQGCTPLPISP